MISEQQPTGNCLAIARERRREKYRRMLSEFESFERNFRKPPILIFSRRRFRIPHALLPR